MNLQTSASNTEKHLSLVMVTLLLFNIFIFNPLFLYLANIEEFTTPLLEIIKLCLVPILILLLSCLLIIIVIPNKVFYRLSTILAALCILTWFQAHVLLWDYGLLDGRNINWGEYTHLGWIDSALWIITIIFSYYFYLKVRKFVLKGAILVFLIQLTTLSFTVFKSWEPLSKTNKIELSNNLDEVFSFSDKSNVLHIIVDGFQSDVFDELLHFEQLKNHYQNSFQGFIFYKETLGVFPYTKFSVPAFLSSEIYNNQVPKNEFIDKTLKENSILGIAHKEKYEIDIVSGDDFLINRYSNLPFNNFYNLENIKNGNKKFYSTAQIIDLALFRASPHFLKKYIYNSQEWLFSKLFINEKIFQFNYFAHTHFLNIFTDAMNAKREKPVYKYIHIMNTHNPMVVNAQCTYAGQASGMTRLLLTIQSMCTLDTLSKLFNRMKDLGIYDNTLIVIHGDHGGWVSNYRQGPPIVFSSGSKAGPWLASLASPLLAIKKPKDNMSFRTTNIQASLLDLPATISDIMNWEANFNSRSLEKISPDESRKRFYYYFNYQKNAHEKQYTGPIQEFSIEGSHYEVEWKAERNFYPPK